MLFVPFYQICRGSDSRHPIVVLDRSNPMPDGGDWNDDSARKYFSEMTIDDLKQHEWYLQKTVTDLGDSVIMGWRQASDGFAFKRNCLFERNETLRIESIRLNSESLLRRILRYKNLNISIVAVNDSDITEGTDFVLIDSTDGSVSARGKELMDLIIDYHQKFPNVNFEREKRGLPPLDEQGINFDREFWIEENRILENRRDRIEREKNECYECVKKQNQDKHQDSAQ